MQLFSICVIASAAVGIAADGVRTGAAFLGRLSDSFSIKYFVSDTRFPGLPAAALFLEGLALMTAVSMLVAQHPALPRRIARVAAFVGLGIAVLNVAAMTGAQLAGSQPSVGRVSATLSDFNAAGSYFVLLLPLVYIELRRVSRWGTIVACSIVLGAIWLTGSRSALVPAIAITLIPGASAMLAAQGKRLAPMLMAAGAATAILVVAVAVATPGLVNNVVSTGDTVMIRGEFITTSLRMLRQSPIFGIGIGAYYPSSWYYMPYRLLLEYRRENAHNNFLQIGAELGVTGLLAFLGVLGAVGMRLRTAAGGGDDFQRRLAIVAGVGAFLVTCLTGHPLLVREVAFPFWIVVGAGLAMTHPVHTTTTSRRARWLTAAAVAVMILSIPARVTTANQMTNWDQTTRGLGPDERTPDGALFRRILGPGILFVPPQSTSVRIPLWGGGSQPEAAVKVFVDGGFGETVMLRPATWTTFTADIDPLPDNGAFHRIDLVPLCGESQTDCDGAGNGGAVGRISYEPR